MKNYYPYLWYVPALVVAFVFGSKLVEGLGGSAEFVSIISVIPFLAPFATMLTPLVGIWDALIAVALLLNPMLTGNRRLQQWLFIWTALWPILPAALRVYGGVGEFETGEVLGTFVAAMLAYYLWNRYAKR